MTLLHPTRLASFQKMQEHNWVSHLLNRICPQAVQPNIQEYQNIQTALMTGDRQMDPVIDWVMENPKKNRQAFETALFQGLDALKQREPVLENFFHHIEQKPTWLSDEKLTHAIEFTHRLGDTHGFVLRDLALMLGYLYPGLNQPLIMTGALSKPGNLRLAETTKWWLDVTEPRGLERFSKGFTSTIYVRFIHAMIRLQLQKMGKWNSKIWGIPINQFDMALTNTAFSHVVLLGIRTLGIFPTQQDTDSFLHLWHYLGWLMGVDETWLGETESHGWRLLYWLKYTHPQADESSIALASNLANEPFARNYPHNKEVQQHVAYKQHLSMSKFFLGKKRLQRLGIEYPEKPWFSYYVLMRNIILHSGVKRISPLNRLMVRYGRQQQLNEFHNYHTDVKKLASMH